MSEDKTTKEVEHIGVSIVYVCHDGKGNILMQKRNCNCRDEHGVWDVGGGGLEFGERVEDALKREIQEEYGTGVLEYEFIDYSDVHRTHEGRKTHWIALCFKVLVDRSAVINGEPHKFDQIAWFCPDGLPDNLHSQLPGFFEKHKARFFPV